MWFTPSEAIKTQTIKKFKDRKDWHRRTLDEAFDNNVKVFSNEEALSIRKEDVADNLCIVIASLEAFRKEKTLQKKYKVYQENGALLNHFENINNCQSGFSLSIRLIFHCRCQRFNCFSRAIARSMSPNSS